MITEIKGRKLKLLLKSKEIHDRIIELGMKMTQDYKRKNPILVGVLKGAFVFLSDLMRRFDMTAQFDFVRVSTYKSGMKPGDIEFIMDVSIPINGRHVILVEDIVDTGVTLKFIQQQILEKKPASFKICALIDLKHRREVQVELDYVGFEIKEGFLVGYGLDMAEEGRNLSDIYVLG